MLNYNTFRDDEKESEASYKAGVIFKRLFDVICALCGCILLLLTCIIICLLDPASALQGKIFFRQKRVGRNGKEFYCLKFRTMAINAEQLLQEVLDKDNDIRALWETHRKIKNDPRITRIGRFLRKTSIDELPQLINVLKGEMSLVGPRPVIADELEFFNAEQLEYYYSVLPGITGLWQISGRNNIDFKGRVALDMDYIRNWSFKNDLVILLKTFLVVLGRKGAY